VGGGLGRKKSWKPPQQKGKTTEKTSPLGGGPGPALLWDPKSSLVGKKTLKKISGANGRPWGLKELKKNIKPKKVVQFPIPCGGGEREQKNTTKTGLFTGGGKEGKDNRGDVLGPKGGWGPLSPEKGMGGVETKTEGSN